MAESTTNEQRTADAARDRAALMDALDELTHAMLITETPEGPRARPMAILHREPTFALWFVTQRDTGKIDEIERGHGRGVGVTAQSRTRFVSMRGSARLIEDDEIAKRHWSPALTPWFPEGPEDEDLILIRFSPTTGELWETGAREVLSFLFEAAKSAAAGERIQPPTRAHTTVSMA